MSCGRRSSAYECEVCYQSETASEHGVLWCADASTCIVGRCYEENEAAKHRAQKIAVLRLYTVAIRKVHRSVSCGRFPEVVQRILGMVVPLIRSILQEKQMRRYFAKDQ